VPRLTIHADFSSYCILGSVVSAFVIAMHACCAVVGYSVVVAAHFCIVKDSENKFFVLHTDLP